MKTNTNHTLKVKLYDNIMLGADNYIARIASDKTLSIEDICHKMVKDRTEYNLQTLKSIIHQFFEVTEDLLTDGYRINTPLFNAAMHINGIFKDETERYAPDKHTISARFEQSASLRKKLKDLEVEITGVTSNKPQILVVRDIKTGSKNDQLSAGNIAVIEGRHIKITGDHPSVGVYLVSTDGVKVKSSSLGENTSVRLSFSIPIDIKGDYRIMITTQFCNRSGNVKKPRTVFSDEYFTVV